MSLALSKRNQLLVAALPVEGFHPIVSVRRELLQKTSLCREKSNSRSLNRIFLAKVCRWRSVAFSTNSELPVVELIVDLCNPIYR